MKDYKAIAEKQAELIDYLISCIENGFDYQIDTLVINKFESELAALEAKRDNPSQVTESDYCGKCANYLNDDICNKCDDSFCMFKSEAKEPACDHHNWWKRLHFKECIDCGFTWNEAKEQEEKPCPNCKETIELCACMRNICKRCGNPVGNITFAICDDCFDKPKAKDYPEFDKSYLDECIAKSRLNQPEAKEPDLNTPFFGNSGAKIPMKEVKSADINLRQILMDYDKFLYGYTNLATEIHVDEFLKTLDNPVDKGKSVIDLDAYKTIEDKEGYPI